MFYFVSFYPHLAFEFASSAVIQNSGSKIQSLEYMIRAHCCVNKVIAKILIVSLCFDFYHSIPKLPYTSKGHK